MNESQISKGKLKERPQARTGKTRRVKTNHKRVKDEQRRNINKLEPITGETWISTEKPGIGKGESGILKG